MDEYWLEPDDPRVLRLQQAAPPCIQIEVDDSPEYRGRRHRRLGYHYVASGYTRFAYYLGPFTDEMLEDFALVLESIDRGDCDDMNDINIYATDLFMYIEGGMIGDKEVTLTITDITLETMRSNERGQQSKPCLHFAEKQKMLVLNKTNVKVIADVLGPQTGAWAGAKVTLVAPWIDAFGKRTRAVRIARVVPPPAASAGGGQTRTPRRAAAAPSKPADDLLDPTSSAGEPGDGLAF